MAMSSCRNNRLWKLSSVFPYILIALILVIYLRCRMDYGDLAVKKTDKNMNTNDFLPDDNALAKTKRKSSKGTVPINSWQIAIPDVGDTLNDTKNSNVTDELNLLLSSALEHKLESVLPRANPRFPETCTKNESREKSCAKSGCLRLSLPRSMRSRVAQLIDPPHLRYNATYQEVFKDMADSVPGYYDIIMVAGASKNYYRESMALLSHLHKFIFPHLKNFTLIFYDLGLTDSQRENISKFCKCHVRVFPFARFPKIFSLLKCYAWKPMIVNAHSSRCNLIHWMDTSIRFSDQKNISKLETLYDRARKYGVQAGCLGGLIPWVTLPSMPHFFGDELCVYHPYKDITAGFMIFHNEPLIQDAVLTPWSACALDEDCMCPYKIVNIIKVVGCPHTFNVYDYGVCHRPEQSALNIILRKLYQRKSPHILIHNIYNYIDIKRRDKVMAT